jgi:hypothetical protein
MVVTLRGKVVHRVADAMEKVAPLFTLAKSGPVEIIAGCWNFFSEDLGRVDIARKLK